MANSYTTVPAIIPGNVQIGGNLTVGGSTFKLGSNPRKYRIQELANGDFYETVNLDTIAVAQDDVTSGSQRRRCNPAVHYHSLETEGAGSPAVHTLRIDMQAGLIYLVSDNVRGGAASPYIRLAKNAVGIPALTMNLSSDLATRDDGAKPSYALIHDEVTPQLYTKLIDAAGNSYNAALRRVFWVDHTLYALTGSTTLTTIATKTIYANQLGPVGGVLIFVAGWAVTGAGGGATISANIGGTTVTALTIPASANGGFWVEISFQNRSVTNQNTLHSRATWGIAGQVTSWTNTTIDTTANQTITLQYQNVAVGDSTNVSTIEAEFIARVANL